MYSYYQIYDFENGKIGFNGDFIDLDPKRPKPYDNQPGTSAIAIVAIIFGILAVIAIGVFAYKKYQAKRLEDQLN